MALKTFGSYLKDQYGPQQSAGHRFVSYSSQEGMKHQHAQSDQQHPNHPPTKSAFKKQVVKKHTQPGHKNPYTSQ